MEFERAIFRVYERCMEGLRDDDPETMSPKSCRTLEGALLGFVCFLLFVLVHLHTTFVGSSGCIPSLLHAELLRRNATTISSGGPLLRKDQILQIDLADSRMAPISLKKALNGSLGGGDDDPGSGERLRKRQLRGRLFAEQSESFEENRNFEMTQQTTLSRKLWQADYFQSDGEATHSSLQNLTLSPSYSPTMNNTQSHLPSPSSPPKSSHSRFQETIHDYEFSFEIGIIALPREIRRAHHFDHINITLPTYQCFGSDFTQALIPFGGVDVVMRNFIMSTFRKPGILVVSSGDYYTWDTQDIQPYETASDYIVFKLNILLASVFSFLLLSSITAMLVRILISSGVVLMFPIFWLLQYFGLHVLNIRIISLSYPWIGVPIEMLRARNQSSVPFVISHLTRVIVYYVLYEAAQMSFAMWFYDERIPTQKELWLFALMMLWEYYSMIYVRARGSIILFPRFSMGCYLIYHFYLYSQPAGFHSLALLILFLLILWNMIFCIRKFEVDAFQRGIVNIDQPRAFYNAIPWPSWSVALAPDLSMFWPVYQQSTSVYDIAANPAGNNPPPGNPAGAVAAAAVAPQPADNAYGGANSAMGYFRSMASSASQWLTGGSGTRGREGDRAQGLHMLPFRGEDGTTSGHGSGAAGLESSGHSTDGLLSHEDLTAGSPTGSTSSTEERLRARRPTASSSSGSSNSNNNMTGNNRNGRFTYNPVAHSQDDD